jgi:hypothetical protein
LPSGSASLWKWLRSASSNGASSRLKYDDKDLQLRTAVLDAVSGNFVVSVNHASRAKVQGLRQRRSAHEGSGQLRHRGCGLQAMAALASQPQAALAIGRPVHHRHAVGGVGAQAGFSSRP